MTATPAPTHTRLRPAIALAITVIAGLGLGYLLSYEVDEETAYQRAKAAQDQRLAEIGRQERAAGRARGDSIMRARRLEAMTVVPAAKGELPAEADWTCRNAVVAAASYCRPYRIENVLYTVEFEPNEQRAVKRVRVHDDSARVVYDEDVAAFVPKDVQGGLKFSVKGVADGAGRERGLWFTYAFRRADRDSVAYRIVVARGGRLQALTPPFNYGELAATPVGAQDGSMRLFEGDRFFVAQWRSDFESFMPYRVDFACTTGSSMCIGPADSIAGLARFEVDPISQIADAHWKAADTTVTIDLFADPAAKQSNRVKIEPGSRIGILGGAGRSLVGKVGDSTYYALMKDDWLQLRVKERTGWIRSNKGFAAIADLARDGPSPEVYLVPQTR
jgi:hypothetical protein